MLRGYKYRIYPNELQMKQFTKHFGCARWVYNWALDKRQQYYSVHKKNLSKRTLQDELVSLKKTEDKKWLNEVNSQTLLAALGHLDEAFKRFFRKQARFPRFKSKYQGHQKYQCPQHVKVDFENFSIDLPKIKGISINLHRIFKGTLKTCTIHKTPTEKYYISILVDADEVEPIPTTVQEAHTVGLDMGIQQFVMTSHGKTIPNHRYLAKSQTVQSDIRLWMEAIFDPDGI